jgi:drug/metabolite transporter (DMT)-like permease
MKSKFLQLNFRDFLYGFLMAFLGALVTGVYQLLQAGLKLDWPHFAPVLLAGASAMLAYLIKNFFQNSDGELLKTEQK